MPLTFTDHRHERRQDVRTSMSSERPHFAQELKNADAISPLMLFERGPSAAEIGGHPDIEHTLWRQGHIDAWAQYPVLPDGS